MIFASKQDGKVENLGEIQDMAIFYLKNMLVLHKKIGDT